MNADERAELRAARQWWWLERVSWVLNHKLLLGWWLLLGTYAALISPWAWPVAAIVGFLLVYPGERV